MEQSDFSKIVTAMRVAYPYYFKELDEANMKSFMQLYYSKLKKYEYQVVATAIDNIITTHDFMPTLAEVLKECDKQYRIINKAKIDQMYKNGYFKTDEEYGKALNWIFDDNPVIPNWLQTDMKKITDIKLVEENGKEQN